MTPSSSGDVLAVNLVNSTTDYVYDWRSQTYLQPSFAFQTLQRFLTVNASTIASLQTQKELRIERRAPIPAGTTLQDLIDVGLKDQVLAPTILSALLEELGQQTQ
jgi:small subunit ribosomal protein S29